MNSTNGMSRFTSASCKCTPDSYPFFCDFHACRKTEHWHRLCQTRADYRAAWDAGRGPGQPLPDYSPPVRLTPAELAVALLERIAQHLARIAERRATAPPAGRSGRRPEIPAPRSIDEIRLIVQTHCQACEMFGGDHCGAIAGCSKVVEYHALLTSPRGHCPRAQW